MITKPADSGGLKIYPGSFRNRDFCFYFIFYGFQMNQMRR